MDPSVKPDPHTQASEPARMSSRDKNAFVNDQPKPSMPMTPKNAQSSGGGDRNALRVPLHDGRLRKWSYDVFNCFSDSRTCALSCCGTSGGSTTLRHMAHPFASQSKGWVLSAISRSDVRRRYGIRGDAINDVLVSGCCHPCELVQEHREIQLEESSFYHM